MERCEVAGTGGRFVIEDMYREVTLYPAGNLEKTVYTNPVFGGFRGFEDTFQDRIHRFLEQVSADVPPEEIDGSGADGLAAQKVLQAAIDSLNTGQYRYRSGVMISYLGEDTMKLGANSVLFGGFDLQTAFETIAMAGYDGIEMSAIDGMSEHLVLDRWQSIAPEIKALSKEFGLELLAMENPSQDPVRMEQAYQAAVEIGIPIINCGPGGKTGDDASLQQSIDSIGNLAVMAEKYGVTLCVKAHVGAAIYNTPTTLQLDGSHHLAGFRH